MRQAFIYKSRLLVQFAFSIIDALGFNKNQKHKSLLDARIRTRI